uniref:Translocon-associated protein subunit delta n=1 Tax=Lepeophtheirus salmonis TaxID=72036 RepID=C1BS84_LEPSM|nr:Translocon-associated protein subunit delta precursor [Lepeophtheirus salmonis]
MGKLVMLIGLLGLFSSVVGGEKCVDPEVKSTSYTSSDSSALTHVPFVADFSLKCSKGAVPSNLYARIPTSTGPVLILPVIHSSSTPNRHQVSWTLETKKAKSGNYQVQLFDEEGYKAIKRAMDHNEDVDAIKPLATVVATRAGAFNGHYINSELLATILSVVIFYVAYTSKTSLLS